ncbi:MAG: BON domain-containing protein [Bdellovibrionaceae bacterium]|nr:BON domain-containing protein [Pseudobdellovibrionaceae bacterium]
MRNRQDQTQNQNQDRNQNYGQNSRQDRGGQGQRDFSQRQNPERHTTKNYSYASDDDYGSTQQSRDFRNQSEDRYQSAMDFGSHNYDPEANHGQHYRGDSDYSSQSSSNDSRSKGSSQGRRNSNERGFNDPRFSSNSEVMERTSSFGAQTYGSQGAGYGQHAGKGPKGYKRSDDRIKEDVSDLIMRHDEIDGSDIEVEVSAGEVTLTGSISDRSTKHMIENLIERTLGVGEVHNQLRVKRADAQDDSDKNAEKSSGGKKPGTSNPRH